MAFIEIHGPCRIQGGLTVQGSKNAVLPIMAASVLNRGITVLENVPRIQDVFCMMGILDSLGCRCALHGNRLEIDTSKMNGWRIEQNAMGKMRSSIMLLGALLGRFCEAGVYSPGGCMIGKRPIDWHLRALRALGAEIQEPESDGFLHAQTTGLRGAEIIFPFPSVGAVENALFAAVAAVGRTVLRGCAREPEIGQLCHFLNGMGASIRGIGTDALIIEGGLPLHDSRFVIGGDRIVAGTYLLAAASCSGEVIVDGVQTQELRALTGVLEHMGVSLYQEPELIYVHSGQRLRAVSVKTGPYPAFPTDLQPFLMAALSRADGTSMLRETVFENRFGTAAELKKMGANIECSGNIARIDGVETLRGALVRARDLRGGAALTVAALGADGWTRVSECEHIERGYEDICRDLRALGAEIRRREDDGDREDTD